MKPVRFRERDLQPRTQLVRVSRAGYDFFEVIGDVPETSRRHVWLKPVGGVLGTSCASYLAQSALWEILE